MVMNSATGSKEWPEALQADFAEHSEHGWVGSRLVSETEKVRVWSLSLAPGERTHFHRHVLDYFWTAVTGGKARSHYGDGSVAETTYEAGETRHMHFGRGEFMVHDLENIGDTDLVFTTVEFLDSDNDPLPVPEWLRR